MIAILDSNILIALWHTKDSRNAESKSLLQHFANGEIKQILITNYVLLEIVNHLLRKVNFDQALNAYRYLTQNERITIVFVVSLFSKEIENWFIKFKNLSPTTCSFLVLA